MRVRYIPKTIYHSAPATVWVASVCRYARYVGMHEQLSYIRVRVRILYCIPTYAAYIYFVGCYLLFLSYCPGQTNVCVCIPPAYIGQNGPRMCGVYKKNTRAVDPGADAG
jgi:hypothetical protein